jgi:hypothetical protein
MIKRLVVFLLLSLVLTISPAQALDMRIPTDMQGHWAVPFLVRAQRWTGGYPDHSWRPDAPITQAEFFTLLSRAMQQRPVQGETPFADQTHWSIAQGWIPAARKAGLIEPSDYIGNQFEPDRLITRQEVIMAAVRAAGHEGQALTGDAPDLAQQNIADLERVPDRLRPWVSLALRHGLVNGYPDRSIRVEGATTRAEALAIVVRIVDHLSLSLTDTHATPARNGRQYSSGEPVWFRQGLDGLRPKIQAGAATYLLPAGAREIQLFPASDARAWISYTLEGQSVLALLAGGGLQEVRRLESSQALTGLAVDAAGALYLNVGATLVRLRQDGAETVIAIHLPLSHAVMDRAGELWAVDEAGTQLVQVTPTGAVNQFSLPVTRPAQAVSTIIPAPDGGLWLLLWDQMNVRTDALKILGGHVQKQLLLLPTRIYSDGAIPPTVAVVSEATAWINRPTKASGPAGVYRFDLVTGAFQVTLAPDAFEGPLQAVPSTAGGALLVDSFGNFWTETGH